MSDNAKKAMLDVATQALQAADIEVVSCDMGGRDRYKIKVKHDMVEATVFTPTPNKTNNRDSDNWVNNLVSSARKTLVMRGARFNKPAPGQSVVVAFSRKEGAIVPPVPYEPEPESETPPVTLSGIAEANNLVDTAIAITQGPAKYKRKPKVFLNQRERTELYASYKKGEFTVAELAELYNIAENTARNVIYAGERGELIDAAITVLQNNREKDAAPAEPAAEPEPTVERVEPAEREYVPTTTTASVFAEVEGVRSRLDKLRDEAAALGITVSYTLNIGWGK